VPNPFHSRIVREYQDRPDELRAAAAKVQATLDSEGWQLLRSFLTRAHDDALTRLFQGSGGANGKVLEQAEYARLCGYLAGLLEPQTAARAYQDAVARLTESPE
jgi:hypothetical protein